MARSYAWFFLIASLTIQFVKKNNNNNNKLDSAFIHIEKPVHISGSVVNQVLKLTGWYYDATCSVTVVIVYAATTIVQLVVR